MLVLRHIELAVLPPMKRKSIVRGSGGREWRMEERRGRIEEKDDRKSMVVMEWRKGIRDSEESIWGFQENRRKKSKSERVKGREEVRTSAIRDLKWALADVRSTFKHWFQSTLFNSTQLKSNQLNLFGLNSIQFNSIQCNSQKVHYFCAIYKI